MNSDFWPRYPKFDRFARIAAETGATILYFDRRGQPQRFVHPTYRERDRQRTEWLVEGLMKRSEVCIVYADERGAEILNAMMMAEPGGPLQ